MCEGAHKQQKETITFDTNFRPFKAMEDCEEQKTYVSFTVW